MGNSQDKKSVVLLSGGPDSATTLGWAMHNGYAPTALHLSYGQINAEREKVAAKKMAHHLGVPIESVDISGLRDIFLDKIGDAIDYNIGCWEVLPFMLGFPISIAISYGLTIGAHTVMIGVHATDVADHPEYRIEALEALATAAEVATEKKVNLAAPFISKTKPEVIAYGASIGLPYFKTWSCLLNGLIHCGKCWGCARRKLAFREADVFDPTEYEYKELIALEKIDLTTMSSARGLVFPQTT